MAKYGIRIIEKLAKTFIVDADSYDEAVQKAHDSYIRGEIILECDDYEEMEIEESETFGRNAIPEDNEKLELFTLLEIEE